MRKYYISNSKIEGKGVFAKRNLKKNEIIFIAKGKLTKWEVYDKKTSLTGPNWIGIKHKVWLDPKEDNPLTFLNHSCDPTLGIKGKVTFRALKDIQKDTELNFDYSTTEEDTLWHLPYICNCKAKNCRKTIRSIQNLPKKKYQKYLPLIPVFFQKVYLRYNKLNENK